MDWRDRLARYFHNTLPSASAVEIEQGGAMPAGASNDTVGIDLAVTCDERRMTVPLVLRPQRRDGILAPYDVSRQFRVMRALQRTAVPVPATAWYEPDTAVLGVPFFVMSRVAGVTPPLFWHGGMTNELLAIGEALAAIHAVDIEAAGLDFLMPCPGPASSIESELAAWRERHRRNGLDGHPISDALYHWLVKNEPADARFALLHGDPNPGNYLLREKSVVGVLDWELAAIGDPRSDLGFYAALMTIFAGAASEDGRSVLSDAYATVTGEELTSLAYYEAAGLYRMAVVIAGWSGPAGVGYALEAIGRRLDHLLGPRWAG